MRSNIRFYATALNGHLTSVYLSAYFPLKSHSPLWVYIAVVSLSSSVVFVPMPPWLIYHTQRFKTPVPVAFALVSSSQIRLFLQALTCNLLIFSPSFTSIPMAERHEINSRPKSFKRLSTEAARLRAERSWLPEADILDDLEIWDEVGGTFTSADSC